ncbi:MAG: hypothetical protein H6745_27950 [Deltaproteobacteria bacterium]|nr:hypothetical protein [Deltaproteobacteria bacterium]
MLVLDGADAVIDALAGDLVALARHAAGRATALVTSSRRPATTADATLVLGGLSPEDGAALFLRAAGGGDERAARDVVTALDGHPLALLLAGAQASALGVAALVARLPSLLDAAEAPLVDVHARHRSLRAALGLSWEALSPAEQRALAALATFAGAFDAAAAEAVIASPDALDLLARLVRASWIGATEGGDARRLRIPAFARHFAAEAAPGAHAAAVPRYRRWVAAAAEAAWRGAAEGDVLRWCDAVAALEHDL